MQLIRKESNIPKYKHSVTISWSSIVNRVFWSLFVPSWRGPSWRFSDVSILVSRNPSPHKTHLLQKLCQAGAAQAIKTIFHATLGSASQKSRPFKYQLSVPQMGGSFKLFQIWFLQLAAQKLAIATIARTNVKLKWFHASLSLPLQNWVNILNANMKRLPPSLLAMCQGARVSSDRFARNSASSKESLGIRRREVGAMACFLAATLATQIHPPASHHRLSSWHFPEFPLHRSNCVQLCTM